MQMVNLNPKKSIRTRLVILFVAQVIIIIFMAGYFLQWRIRTLLEQELGKQLETVANSVSIQMDGEILASLSPGDERTRTYQNLINKLQLVKSKTGMQRISLFDQSFRSLADTESQFQIGREYSHLKFDEQELIDVFQGKTASSVLFNGIDGRLYKSGYAPIFLNREVIAAVRVEGSAKTLESIEGIRRNLVTLGILAVFISGILAIIFSNRITASIKKLQKSALEIGEGNYEKAVQFQSQDEVGFLARTLEEMRQNIIKRDTQQKAMLAGVAHEIRNPLGGIELFAGLLADELTSTDAKNQALKILNEVKNLKTIVQGFLDYARPARPEKQACVIKTTFDEAIHLLVNDLTDIHVQYDEQPDGITALVDPQHLKQVFLNLIQNSIHACAEDGLIEVKITQNRNQKVEILFADNGSGIPPASKDKIFDPFYTTKDTGIGLGLAIVKSLIEANGGAIELLDNVHNGTVFKIELPAG